MHRLRGEFAEADEAYHQASRWGREPQPGLARLRLAQGRVPAAEAAIRRVADEAQDRVTRSRLLPARRRGDARPPVTSRGTPAADELSNIAGDLDSPLLRALAAHAQGAVLLARGGRESRAQRTAPRVGRVAGARGAVRNGEGPHPDRSRVPGARGPRTARRWSSKRQAGSSRSSAHWPTSRGRRGCLRGPPAAPAGGLTARELDVLRLVATGKTNRSVAADLFLSEKTVARHVSNIFNKLGRVEQGSRDRLRLRARSRLSACTEIPASGGRAIWVICPMRPSALLRSVACDEHESHPAETSTRSGKRSSAAGSTRSRRPSPRAGSAGEPASRRPQPRSASG